MPLVDVKPRVVSACRDLIEKVTLAAACVAGDVIGINTSTWILGIEANSAYAMVALEDGAIGQVINAAPWALIKSFTGGTAGAKLSSGAAGIYQEGTGYSLGIVVSATEGYVLPLLLPVAP